MATQRVNIISDLKCSLAHLNDAKIKLEYYELPTTQINSLITETTNLITEIENEQ